MGLKRYKWHKVADGPGGLIFSPGGIAVADIEGKKICIAKDGDSWYGFAYNCPHAGGIMAEGWLDEKGNVVCPVHRYTFSLKNGRNSSGEGYHIKRYPVELRPDGVYAGIEEGGLFKWF